MHPSDVCDCCGLTFQELDEDREDRRPTREEIESVIRSQGRNAYTLSTGIFPLPYTCEVCGSVFDSPEKLETIYVKLPGADVPVTACRCVDCFERICREVETNAVIVEARAEK